MATVQQLIDGYGPDFPPLEDLMGITAEEADILRLQSPSTSLGRYFKSVAHLQGVTSQQSVALKRFHVAAEYFIALADQLTDYRGIHKDHRIVHSLTSDQKAKIRTLATTPDDILRAEKIERFSDHDTAAATDYLKIRIGTEMPELESMLEGMHFACTSEDNMGNVMGMMANELFFGYIVPALLDFADTAMDFVSKYESDGPLVLPAETHQQAAEPTTLGKKFMNHLTSLNIAMGRFLNQDADFIPFSGKLGGAIGDLKTHYAAYPDIDWIPFAEDFVHSLGLSYNCMSNQCSLYAIEAGHFTTLANCITSVLKFTDDFISMASCPAQLFVKIPKPGKKGSSIMPGKSNAWGMEGARKMLRKVRNELFFYARELPDYPHEGDMGRSYLMRALGDVTMPLFIGLNRIRRELNSYQPNPDKINAFFHEYPGMAGSVIQTILKRHGIEGDAYRTIQGISINSNGSYANATQFRAGLKRVSEELELSQGVRDELAAFADPGRSAKYSDDLAKRSMPKLEETFRIRRESLAKYKPKE